MEGYSYLEAAGGLILHRPVGGSPAEVLLVVQLDMRLMAQSPEQVFSKLISTLSVLVFFSLPDNLLMVGEAGHHEGSLAEVVGDVDIDLVLGEEEVQELGVVEDRGQVEA